MEAKTLAIIIILAAAGLLVLGGLMEATSDGSILSPKGGQEVNCNVQLNAQLTGDLEIKGATCSRIGNCAVNPLKKLTIGDVEGELQLLQSGVVYDSEEVIKNRLAPSSSFQIGACIPAEASSVRIQVLNDQGGVDDDREIKIQ